MRRTLLSAVAALLLTGAASAQERAVVKGQNSVNLFYGPLNLTSSFIKSVVDQSEVQNFNYKRFGPIGLMYEHMVSDVVGLGIEASYVQHTLTYGEFDTDPTTGQGNWYNAEWKITTIRAFFRANFHFIKSPNFDGYAFIAAGYRNTTYSFKWDSPWGNDNQSLNGFIPFGVKPGIGFRYFFAGPLGVNLELAAGTPALAVGLSARF